MFNEHDIRASYIENPFPVQTTMPIVTTNPTKMNIIIPVIPESMRNIMDLVLLVTGVSLNAFLGLFIALNSTMYSSTNCYVVGLVFSNVVILLEPLQRIIEWIFDIRLEMDLDYVFLISFATSILTIILLNIEAYIVICKKNSPLRKSFLKISTAMKGLLFIWTTCIMVIAMELHLYDHFERDVMHDIYVSSTIMFLVFPCFIFIMLDYFILYDLIISKSINGMWPSKDIEHFIFLVGVSMGFFLTMIPYRITRSMRFLSKSYHNDTVIEITYTMVKVYPIILPIICFATSKEFHQTLKIMLHCQQHETSAIT
ncbi:uncharacterized protein LOC112452624 [Temnothorax curvispinosus]|uniref:Uncharacterized protein LOC112452624 n=1 Tax=Temnothorax curvispinosus TaxID=300111 RepID=A0A6J1PHI3_9HYME|nr:uncharacterized protein LOC112452624 [Temnothorax curvispinosus]